MHYVYTVIFVICFTLQLLMINKKMRDVEVIVWFVAEKIS